jgi:Fe-Mn family superoxide dismutase
MTTRREILLGAGIAAAALYAERQAAAQTTPPAPTGPYTLPPLPYPFDALEPYIDAQTMQIHHDRHHAAYVNNLNNAVAKFPEVGKRSAEELVRNLAAVPEEIRTAVRNNAGGHVNHDFFWKLMSKSGPRTPTGELAKAIDQRFGSFSKFQEEFTRAAATVFGSGWAWLTVDGKGQLSVLQTANQDSPLSLGQTPLVGIDVWEHAYYLKYQNRRADYIAAFYNVIHWDWVSARYSELSKRG